VLGYPIPYQWRVNALMPFLFATGKSARMVQVATFNLNVIRISFHR